ncbi:glycoside hydrolase family 5 protein [Maribacter sp. SA7]|uniref:glycoside hydrolase family 5 protein n=1 Tax=Maribacter zhoushanensis TaxID=3030012 RepID=UPI0023EBCCB3|nr:glycoside hydrolase family 5 protein [Maribacter zhoushanensis]MDF4204300.1 glycoside hydrolase family 5 protein [Maribacter zhoushanensis]
MKNTILVFVLLIVAIITGCSGSENPVNNGSSEEIDNVEIPSDDSGSDEVIDGTMRDISPKEFVLDMGSGWNLGNTLDTEDVDVTAWGNPLTTKAMIDEIANMGFKTLRLPVTWQYHTGSAPDYLLETDWLNTVENIANFALSNDMYVIINIHHDDEWIVPTYENAPLVKDRLTKTWTQIANRFKPYGDYVIFETLNEPRHEGSPEEWEGGTAEGRDVVNQYHQVSVDAIRATDGNNAVRKIMVSTYAAGTGENVLQDYIVPNNDENVIVSIHSYSPYLFSLAGTDPIWGTDEDKAQLTQEFNTIQNKFESEGRAVVMGEWGSTFSDNENDRLAHAEYYANLCAERGICPIWWDNGNADEFGIFNRNTLEWVYPEIAEAIVNATN